MSNETKRDVFKRTLEAWEELVHDVDLQGEEIHGGCEFDSVLFKYEKDYDAALPDDLPVIPKVASEYIIWCKGNGGIGNVLDAMSYAPEITASWIYDERNPDIFALAWLLGVWRVEETGEIVKLEAEK